MAFLKFLEKERRDLDLPSELPPLPPLEETKIAPRESLELPSLSEPQMGNEEISAFPEIPEKEPPAELPPFPDVVTLPMAEAIEEGEVEKERKELRELRQRVVGKQIFVSIDSFKEVLADIDSIKVELRNQDQCLQNAVEIKNEQDKLFDAWHGKFKDLERKFMFIDKTLFETKYV